MTWVNLDDLLSEADAHVKSELASKPDVEPVGGGLTLDQLQVTGRRWAQVDEIVAVLADLKDSTKLGTGKHAASTASIYEAAVGPAVQILDKFKANDIDIQGDCAIGLFWGEDRMERALCSGITIKTFSQRHLESQLESKWPDAPKTGFKVGIAASRILVKRVGAPRKPDYQEEIWVGKAVNYASKAAQCSERHELWVTGGVWDRIESNDYIVYTCGCPNGEPSHSIWADVEITQLPEDDQDRYGRKLTSMWCLEHGADFCEAILSGERTRSDVKAARQSLQKKLFEDSIAKKRQQALQLRRARYGSGS